MVLKDKRNKAVTLLVVVMMLVLAVLGLVSYILHHSQSPPPINYLTHGTPTSQWLVLAFLRPPSGVSANNTGPIPEYLSSESLNETEIGVYCTQTVTAVSPAGTNSIGTCTKFTTLQQTGWYWDQESKLLFIHYLGGPSVEISIST